nr:CrcB family protein [Antricoccus suffuscus]
MRYGAGQLVPHSTGWPVATFVVNVIGALVLGVLLEALSRSNSIAGTRIRLLCGTGFCGGLTTYSTFAVEIDLLIRGGSAWLGAAYGVGTLIAGVVAAYAGIAFATRVRS